MSNSLPGLLLLLLCLQGASQTVRPGPLWGAVHDLCPAFRPNPDPQKWTWLDRDCKQHSRAELETILARHKQWLNKYGKELAKAKGEFAGNSDEGIDRDLPTQARNDPLRANLSGTTLIGIDLRRWPPADSLLDGGVQNLEDFGSVDLSGANLDGADLSGGELFNWDLSGAMLQNANLSNSRLYGADLSTALLQGVSLEHASSGGAHLANANLRMANLRDADFGGADMKGADLWGANLMGANLGYTDLTGARIWDCQLNGALLQGAKLNGATLADSDLTGADLTGAYLKDTQLLGARLSDVIFEPHVLPPAAEIARAKGLRTLRWEDRIVIRNGDFLSRTEPPTPKLFGRIFVEQFLAPIWLGIREAWLRMLSRGPSLEAMEQTSIQSAPQPNSYPVRDLIKALHDAKYREAEAEVNLAYHRRTQRWWQIPLFDWSCEWGADWSRPIWITLTLGGFFALLYWSILRFGSRKRIYQPANSNVGEPRSQPPRPNGSSGTMETRFRHGKRYGPRRISELFVIARKYGNERQWRVGRDYFPKPYIFLPQPREKRWLLRSPWSIFLSVRARIAWERPLLWTALLFSAINIVNLGIQGLDIGRWIRLVQSRDFDLRARGRLRLLAGLQSVVSFLLLALSAFILITGPIE